MNARFIFTFDSNDDARVIEKSLEPEIKHKIPKTTIHIHSSPNTLILTINAEDLNSLRASCNSYLRWINTALSVKKSL